MFGVFSLSQLLMHWLVKWLRPELKSATRIGAGIIRAF